MLAICMEEEEEEAEEEEEEEEEEEATTGGRAPQLAVRFTVGWGTSARGLHVFLFQTQNQFFIFRKFNKTNTVTRFDVCRELRF